MGSQRRKKSKESPFSMLLTTSSTCQSDQQRSHSECLFQVSTRSRVLVMSLPAESSKEHSSQTSTLSSHQLESPENASQLKCTTNQSQKLDQETTSESTSRVFQKKTCPRSEMLCQLRTMMVMLIHQKQLIPSELPFSFKTILDS